MDNAATVERVWMSYAEACAHTAYDRTTLWRAVKRGELRIGGTPGAPRFERRELDRWMRGAGVEI